MLAQSQVDREKRHQESQGHANKRGHEHAEPEGTRGNGDQEPGHGAHEHDALNAQIEHAGPLGKNLTQHGEDDGGRHSHHGPDQSRDKRRFENLVHHFRTTFIRYSVKRRKMSMTMRAMPWITSAM